MSDIRVRSMWMLTPLTRLGVALAAIGVFGTPQLSSSPPQRTATVKALVGGTLVDGFGGRPIRNSVVLIEGERISAVGQVGVLAVPPGAEVISTEGMSVLSGLWDMHVHLMINGHAWVNILGVDPMTAIRAATYWPSVAMKVDGDVGTVSPGKYADVIAARGDVLRHIALLQRVDIVVKRGTRYR